MRIISLTLLFLICALSLYSQKIQTSLRQTWHNNTWQDSLLDTYTYDSRGLLATTTEQRWSPATDTWIDSRRDSHTYNADSTEQQQITQTWDATGHVWQNQKMVTFTHLSHGGASILYSKWVNGSWQNELQVASINDNKGLLSKSLKQKWDAAAGIWVNDIRADYTCHSNGKIDHYVCQIWDTATQDWSKKRKDQCRFAYDKSGRSLGNTNDILVHNIRIRHTSKNIISYDGQGHKTSTSFTDWDTPSRSWIELLREDYTNNSDGSVSSYTCQQWHRSGGEPYSKVMTKYSYF